jgi:formylglycine-generating enzyme required for sulfatase activity
MAAWQAAGRWAAAVVAAALLAAPGCSSEPPKELNLDLGGGVTMKLVLIPAGKFMMGSPDSEQRLEGFVNEGPQHEVTLSKPFYVGVTEVTQAQYQAIMGTNPSHFKGATNPVEMVSGKDATEFFGKLSEKTHMHGNLLEWCADWEGDYPNGAVTDPQGPASGTRRVLRGGGWVLNPDYCRSAYRDFNSPECPNINYGFRVAVSVSAPRF